MPLNLRQVYVNVLLDFGVRSVDKYKCIIAESFRAYDDLSPSLGGVLFSRNEGHKDI